MVDKINGRTPEEIKKGLECYITYNTGGCENILCRDCPHYDPNSAYTISACKDALAYIQQLERERDAAVEDLENASACFACKHFKRNSGNCFGGCTCLHNIHMAELADVEYNGVSFEWRGVQEVE